MLKFHDVDVYDDAVGIGMVEIVSHSDLVADGDPGAEADNERSVGRLFLCSRV